MEGEILGHARDCVRVSVYVMFETIERYSNTNTDGKAKRVGLKIRSSLNPTPKFS